MEQADLERRLGALEGDLEKSGERMAERRAHIRESLSAVKAVVRADVEGFAKRFGEQLPVEIDQSDAKDLKKYLAGFIEEEFRKFAEREAEEITTRLEKVADEAIAFVAEDAARQAERLRSALGADAPKLDLAVDTFAYDVGVFAVGAFGVTLAVLGNFLVGGALALAAPVLAMVFRGRSDRAMKERAKEAAPGVVAEAGQKMAEAFDGRIDEFGEKLIAFVTQATEETTKSIAELVRAARDAKAEGEVAQTMLQDETGMSLTRLVEVEGKISALRKSLWANGHADGMA